MNEENRVSVLILDKEYQVACRPEERHDLKRAASELDERMRAAKRSGNIVGLDRIAIMVALNLCHELQSKSGAVDDPESESAIERINKKLDSALS